MKIQKPTLFIDEYRCKLNIHLMAEKARENNCIFRPHFKTHQSLEIGSWFKNEGVTKITVSSLEMAEYFASEWNDITVAFPVNVLEIDTINALAAKIQLNLIIESIDTVDFLAKNLRSNIHYFLKIDVGYHRTGLNPDSFELMEEINLAATKSTKLKFKGFLGHAGHTYKCKSNEAIRQVDQESRDLMNKLKNHFMKDFPQLIISLGDTPSCSVSHDFKGIDEIRPGNFVFYDLTQYVISSNTIDQIALAMACPIVAIHPEKNEIVVYGGGIHFAKDRLEFQGKGIVWGLVVENPISNSLSETGKIWGEPVLDMYVSSLSQEHGIVTVPSERINQYVLGDIIYILPVHSCMTGHAMGKYFTHEGRVIERF